MTATTRPQTFAAALAALPTHAQPTDKMLLAVKQRWTVAPGTSPELRKQLGAVEPVTTPTASELHADPTFAPEVERGPVGAADEPRMIVAVTEAKRLAGNAKVNAWRERSRLQATIDLRAVQMKARTSKPAPDPADVAEAADSAADVSA